jgi:hypothetical protein
MRIDVTLLKEQIAFLDNYPWRNSVMPEEIIGIVNLLDAILDEEDKNDYED